ncbi:MAG: hypothetical protein ACSHYF_03120 [Verrucomicrobiaceae bacterium]
MGLKKPGEDSRKDFQKNFPGASEEQKKGVCDEVAKGNYFSKVFTGITSATPEIALPLG